MHHFINIQERSFRDKSKGKNRVALSSLQQMIDEVDLGIFVYTCYCFPLFLHVCTHVCTCRSLSIQFHVCNLRRKKLTEEDMLLFVENLTVNQAKANFCQSFPETEKLQCTFTERDNAYF